MDFLGLPFIDYNSFKDFILTIDTFDNTAIVIAFMLFNFIKIYVIVQVIHYSIKFFNLLRGAI